MKHLCSVVVLCILISFYSETGYTQERRIEPGDVLQITVLGRPDLTRTVVVNEDGTISYPFIGEENVTGYSLQMLRVLIFARLTSVLDEPVDAVDVTWASQTTGEQLNVTVLGQVTTPGVVAVEGDAGIQGAITAAGGFLPGARIQEIKVHRTTPDGSSEILVDLEKFFETGDLGYIPPLQESDIIIVPGGTATSAIRVLGAVVNPGAYQPVPGSTVFDMILQAGGFADDARLDRVKLVKPTTGVTEEYAINFAEFLSTGQQPVSPPVEPGDVIIVPERLITYGKTLGVLQDLTSVITLITFFVFLFTR